MLWHLEWVTQKGVRVLTVTTAVLTEVLVCSIMAGRLQFGVEHDRILCLNVQKRDKACRPVRVMLCPKGLQGRFTCP